MRKSIAMLGACLGLTVLIVAGISGSRAGDGYYPNVNSNAHSGLSGALRGDLSGRLGGSMPVSPDMARRPVAYACGVCRAECEQKWLFSCGGQRGCRSHLSACMQACWLNDCRGSR